MNGDIISFLKSTLLFSDIPEDGFLKLLECVTYGLKTYLRGEILVLAGERQTHIGILLSGRAQAYSETASGKRALISTLVPGSIYGEALASSVSVRSPVTVYASEKTEVILFPFERILCRGCGSPCGNRDILSGNLLKIIANGYFALNRRINILRSGGLRGRLCAYLFFLYELNSSRSFTLPMSKTALSEYLMADRTAMSRELRRMTDEGLIKTVRRQVVIEDITSLCRYI